MKTQWTLIFALIFALLIAVFAVFNVERVPVSYVFGEASIPLIIVILSSTLVGGLVVGLIGLFRQWGQSRKIKALEKQIEQLKQGSTNGNDVNKLELTPSAESSTPSIHSTEESDSSAIPHSEASNSEKIT